MYLWDRLMTRRRGSPRFSSLPARVRRRLSVACHELTATEEEVARQLGLPEPPRLLMIDEEEAVVLTPNNRGEIP